MPWLTEHFGNPHSRSHEAGRDAAGAIDDSIDRIAQHLGTSPDKVIITSGATESLNLALRGVMTHPRNRRRRLVTCTTEHPAALEIAADLQSQSMEVVYVAVHPQGHPRSGQIDLEQLDQAVNDETALVSVMVANNEVGSVHPINEVARITHARGALLHCDGSQAVGRLPIDVIHQDIDLLTASAHKFYGPKGIGFLTVGNNNRRVRLRPQTVGGGQQRGIRGGTMNPAAIVAMAVAMDIAVKEQVVAPEKIASLRNRMWTKLRAAFPEIILHGPTLEAELPGSDWPARLPGNLNVRLPDIEGEAWMSAAPEIAISSGSACSSTDGLPSHVLLAMGLTESEARRSIRIGVGRFNTDADIDAASQCLIAAAAKLRNNQYS